MTKTKAIGSVAAVLGAVVFTYGCTNSSNTGDLFGNSDGGTPSNGSGLFGVGGGTKSGQGGNAGTTPSGTTPASSSSGGATSGVCAAKSDDDACTSCMRSSCCAEISACDETCKTCAQTCEDQSCIDDCTKQSPASASAYRAVVTCGQKACGSQCGG